MFANPVHSTISMVDNMMPSKISKTGLPQHEERAEEEEELDEEKKATDNPSYIRGYDNDAVYEFRNVSPDLAHDSEVLVIPDGNETRLYYFLGKDA